jgi:hypothetical protein
LLLLSIFIGGCLFGAWAFLVFGGFGSGRGGEGEGGGFNAKARALLQAHGF